MNLNKIETDQPGFILQISWNKAEGKNPQLNQMKT